MSHRSADVLELRPDHAREVAEAVTYRFGCREGDRNEARRPLT